MSDIKKQIIIKSVLKYYGIDLPELATSYKNNNQSNAREVLWWWLHDKENISSEKIAEVFQTNVGMVNVVISRFRKKTIYPYAQDVISFIASEIERLIGVQAP